MFRKVTFAVSAAVCAALIAGCSSSDDATDSTTSTVATATTAMNMDMTGVASIKNADDLRARLNVLLGDHLILASKATGAALGGRTDEFTAYSTQLNTNGTDLGEYIGAAFGDAAKNQFNSIWSAHNGFFVDYTTGVAKKDEAAKAKAVSDLTTVYVPQFSKFVADATGLPLATVTSLVTEHVTTTKDVVDAQAAGDWTKTVPAEQKAYTHMQMIADPLSAAISTKFPDKFPAGGTTKAADLRVTMDTALVDHLYLATSATAAALGGRTDEFNAYAKQLNTNGTDIGGVIGGAYGTDAQAQFNSIWSAHNGFFVDYTTGVAKNDEAAKTKAVSDLTTVYVPQFSKFIADATGLPLEAVTSLITAHVTGTKQVVDDQGAKSWTKAAADDRAAALHMQSIGDAVAEATAKKFPAKFSA